jgi:PKD repeat protein
MKNYLKLIVLLFLLVFSTPQLLADDVFENFDHGVGGFFETKSFYVSNNRFVWKGDGRENATTYIVWSGGSNPGHFDAKPEHSNYFTDFNASVDAIWLAGSQNDGYGIHVCNTENSLGHDNRVTFFISNNGSFIINKRIEGNYKKWEEQTEGSLIKENQYNKLSIAKSGNEFKFYINDVEVKRLVIDGCAGGSIGLSISQSLDAAFDNFHIKDLSNHQNLNQAPIASFTMSPTQGNAPLTVILNANSSFDPDGIITAYQWSSSDGQTANGKNVQLIFHNPGTYTITLTVTDDKGATAQITKTVIVTAAVTQTPETTPTNNENVAELKFIDYKPFYQVGEMLKLYLQANIITNRNQRVDLWVSLQLPNQSILYMTPKITELFSTKAQPFIKSIERIDETYPILHLQVPEGIGGNYTVSAIFIKEGKNFITGGPSVIKSNVAIAEIVLSDR